MSELIYLFYTQFERELPDSILDNYQDRLPQILNKKNSKYIRWQDRYSHLFGKLLLLRGLEKFGYSSDILDQIHYNEFDRPYLKSNIDFNISHSGNYVMCAIGTDIKIGIDIEEIKNINFNDFKNVMTPYQWKIINSSSYPLQSFFRYWTIKESIIKADSRGLSIPLLDIQIQKNTAIYDNQKWFFKELSLDANYCTCIAHDINDIDYEIQKINFYHDYLF